MEFIQNLFKMSTIFLSFVNENLQRHHQRTQWGRLGVFSHLRCFMGCIPIRNQSSQFYFSFLDVINPTLYRQTLNTTYTFINKLFVMCPKQCFEWQCCYKIYLVGIQVFHIVSCRNSSFKKELYMSITQVIQSQRYRIIQASTHSCWSHFKLMAWKLLC